MLSAVVLLCGSKKTNDAWREMSFCEEEPGGVISLPFHRVLRSPTIIIFIDKCFIKCSVGECEGRTGNMVRSV